jgi:hypothetical protein
MINVLIEERLGPFRSGRILEGRASNPGKCFARCCGYAARSWPGRDFLLARTARPRRITLSRHIGGVTADAYVKTGVAAAQNALGVLNA